MLRNVRSPPSQRRFLLDELPLEICCRIVAYVSRCNTYYLPTTVQARFQTRSTLALAETTPKQRMAVQVLFSHQLLVQMDNMERWINVFNAVQNIDVVQNSPHLDPCKYVSVLELLNTKNLCVATIPIRPEYVRIASKWTMLRELHIDINRISHARYMVLMTALKKLKNLTSLSLVCTCRLQCFFADHLYNQAAFMDLASRCSKLKCLRVLCSCRKPRQVDFGPLVDTFPHLQRLEINKHLPDYALSYLQMRESVILRGMPEDACRYAAEIGHAVTGITSFVDSFDNALWPASLADGTDIRLLGKCRRLEKLHLDLRKYAERSFPTVLTNLRSLRLKWIRGNDWCCLEAGWLTKLVGRTPELRELSLIGVQICFMELKNALQRIGLKLHTFETSSIGQDERPAQRVLGLIDTVTKYNYEVREFCVRDIDKYGKENFEAIDNQIGDKEKAMLERQFGRSIVLLHRRAPMLDLVNMKDTFHRLLGPFTWQFDRHLNDGRIGRIESRYEPNHVAFQRFSQRQVML